MAQKVQTLFVDDLDGSEAEGTVRFGLDGTEYEIDLNAQHARQLRDALARYVAAGRRASAGTRRPARGGRKAQPNALNTTEVREWAKAGQGPGHRRQRPRPGTCRTRSQIQGRAGPVESGRSCPIKVRSKHAHMTEMRALPSG